MKLKKSVFFSCISFFIFSNVHSMEKLPKDWLDQLILEKQWLSALLDVRKKKEIFNNTQEGRDYQAAAILYKKYPSWERYVLKGEKFGIVMVTQEFQEYNAAKQNELVLRYQVQLKREQMQLKLQELL